jgi:uncharacterized membrane protein YphA (DoxX/SURF4 family)
MRVAKEVALWVICLFLVYVFLKAGGQKFSDTSGWARAFRFWGFPTWFRILVGGVELGAALLLLHPRTASLGASMFVVVMLGGMGTHIATGRPKQVTSEVFPLTLATVVLVGRRKLLPLPGRARQAMAA